jgi:hypothetical protein
MAGLAENRCAEFPKCVTGYVLVAVWAYEKPTGERRI